MTGPRGARLPRRTPGAISRAIGDDFVVVDPTTHTAHALTGAHATVWRAIGSDGSTRTSLPEPDVHAVVADLVALGLVTTPPGMGRRDLLRRGAAVSGLVVGAGVTSLVLPEAAAAASTILRTDTRTTAGNYTFQAPAGTLRIDFTIIGGGGSGRLYADGGGGASISGSILPGTQSLGSKYLNGIVGAGGNRAGTGGAGAGDGQGNGSTGGGGGGTSLRIGADNPGGLIGGILGSPATANVLAVLSGGGGGAGYSPSTDSGNGGGGQAAGTAATGFQSGNGGGGGAPTGRSATGATGGAAGAAGGGVAGAAGANATAATGNGGANGGAPSNNGGTTRGGGGGGGYGGGGSGGAGSSSGGGGGGGGNYTFGTTGYTINYISTGIVANNGTTGGTAALNDADAGSITLKYVG